MDFRSSQGFQVCFCFSDLTEITTVFFWLSILIICAGESHEDDWGMILLQEICFGMIYDLMFTKTDAPNTIIPDSLAVRPGMELNTTMPFL